MPVNVKSTMKIKSHAGRDHADAFANADLFVVGERLLDAADQLLRQRVDVFVGLETADDAELLAHQVGDEDVSARGANVDADDAAFARVDVKKSRAAATADGFAECAFEDERLAEEFADEEAGDAAADVHEAGEVRARDWLMSTNEVQRDLTINLARGAAPGDFKIMWIDLAHA